MVLMFSRKDGGSRSRQVIAKQEKSIRVPAHPGRQCDGQPSQICTQLVDLSSELGLWYVARLAHTHPSIHRLVTGLKVEVHGRYVVP